MHHRFRSIASAILALVLFLSLASPAAAESALGRDTGDLEKSVPVVIDVLLLRPMGFAMTVVGAAFYAFPVAPITAVTRPSDLFKPFKVMVAVPAKYTFVDPIGQH